MMSDTDRLRVQISASLSQGLIAAAFAALAGGTAGFAALADKLPSGFTIAICLLVFLAAGLLFKSIFHGGKGQHASGRAIKGNPDALVDDYDDGHFSRQAKYGLFGLLVEVIALLLAATVSSFNAHSTKLGDQQRQMGRREPARLELLGYVGPFKQGSNDILEDSGSWGDSSSCRCGTQEHVLQSIKSELRRASLVGLLVIGSADKTELQASLRREYGSNGGLARVRAEWVSSQLKSIDVFPRDGSNLITLTVGPSIHGQRLLPKQTAPDRNVAIWGIWSDNSSSSPAS